MSLTVTVDVQVTGCDKVDGYFQVFVQAEPGVNVYPLIVQEIYKQTTRTDFKILSIIFQ
jgi:hypothetical protein